MKLSPLKRPDARDLRIGERAGGLAKPDSSIMEPLDDKPTGPRLRMRIGERHRPRRTKVEHAAVHHGERVEIKGTSRLAKRRAIAEDEIPLSNCTRPCLRYVAIGPLVIRLLEVIPP